MRPDSDPERDQDVADEQAQSEQGTEGYGGDPDAEPSLADEQVERDRDRDQAEG